MADEWLTIGKVVAPQGLRGEVRVYPLSDFPERFLVPGKRWLKRPRQPTQGPSQGTAQGGPTGLEAIELVSGRYVENKNLYVLGFEGVEDRDQAEALRGAELLVPASDRPYLEPGEFYVLDLIGMTVVLQADQSLLGVVKDVLSMGNDLLEVELTPGELASVGDQPEELQQFGPENYVDALPRSKPSAKPAASRCILIPFVKEIVPVVDLDARRMEVTPPPGLLDL